MEPSEAGYPDGVAFGCKPSPHAAGHAASDASSNATDTASSARGPSSGGNGGGLGSGLGSSIAHAYFWTDKNLGALRHLDLASSSPSSPPLPATLIGGLKTPKGFSVLCDGVSGL